MSERRPAEHLRLIEEVRATGEMVGKFFLHEQLSPILASSLTMQQLKLVALLWTHGPLGGHELARHLDVSMPTVTGTVDRLVDRGVVERREDPADRRVRLAALTPAGEALVADYDASGWSLAQELLETMPVDDLRALAQGLAAMWTAVEGRAADAGATTACTSGRCAPTGGTGTAP